LDLGLRKEVGSCDEGTIQPLVCRKGVGGIRLRVHNDDGDAARIDSFFFGVALSVTGLGCTAVL